MRTRRITALLSSLMLVGGLLGMAEPAGAQTSRPARTFAAGAVRLDGGQEVPPADADGRGLFAYVASTSKLCYVLTARRIEPAAMAHIHAGPRGVNGPIVVALTAPTDGLSADCITAQPDSTPNGPDVLLQSELAQILADPTGFYANVHNGAFPNGAIRGQLR